MKVLMLGWEFPPHISGGLGTACYGLAQGLSANEVAVEFVVPRVYGDEDTRYAQVVGCNQLGAGEAGAGPAAPAMHARPAAPVTPATPATPATQSAGATAPPVAAVPAEAPHARESYLDPPVGLSPYLDEEGFAKRLAELGAVPGLPDGGQFSAEVLLAAAAEPEVLMRLPELAKVAGARAWSVSAGQLSGQYGGNLMEEVARFALAVVEIARGSEFDLIHAHDWMTYPAGILAARATGKPLVIHIHATEYDRTGEHPNGRIRDLEAMGFHAARFIMPVSHYTASVIRRRYGADPAKIRVVHNSVSQSEQRETWHVERSIPEPVVLFLGRVTFQKGPEYFLEAAARVLEIEPEVKFVMSGSGDMLPSMVEYAAQLGLARHVHFTGFLRGKDVELMYAMADLYVMPSVSEPFGITPLEAVALDVPTIVSRQSGVSEVLTDALKFDFWDVEDLANKILAILRYPALRDFLVHEGREQVSRMRWEVSGAKVKKVYSEALA